MRRVGSMLVVLVLFLSVSNATASYAWYYGKVSRVFSHASGFIVMLDSGVLSDCQHGYAYFTTSTLGVEATNRAYSMALAAQTSGKTMGIVIDKAVNGPGGRCDSNGNVDITG